MPRLKNFKCPICGEPMVRCYIRIKINGKYVFKSVGWYCPTDNICVR